MSEQLFIALLLLSVAKRSELRDHAFGDREVFWDLDLVAAEDFSREEGSVAGGYFGSGSASLWMVHSTLSWSGEVARDLAKLGGLGVIERNDSTGPDTYAEGVTMPALTLEGVAAEISIDMRGQDEDFVDTYTEHEDFERDAYFANQHGFGTRW
jgi:hypothetical protein